MKYSLQIVLFTAAILLLFSCKKYLDVAPDNIATIESSFSNANETEAYLFGCYANMQRLSDITRNPGFTASGEVIFPINLPNNQSLTGSGQDAGFNLMRGIQNTTNPIMNYWDGYNMGLNLWQSIRMCNTFINNVNLPLDVQAYQRIRWVAEAKFLKAYYHYWLIRMYGPIPIADKEIAVNATTEEVRQIQQPVDSCFNYVVKLLDEAIPDLPPTIQNVAVESGRITSAIALAVKAEVLATQASPLFNGNPDYSSFKRKSDGVNYFSTTADPAKWQRAADACKAAIDAATAIGNQLYVFQPKTNIVHMSDTTKDLLTLQGAFVDSWNPEQVWTLNPYFNYQIQASPRVTADAIVVYNFFSNFSVPIGQTELFYTNSGVPINEDKNWDYTNRFELVQGDDANRYYTRRGYYTNKANLNREKRYYSSVAFDGALWFGSGITDDNNSNFVNAVNGPAAPLDPISYNATGYWPKKLVPFQTTFGQTSVQQPYSWPFMRLTSLWLLYAECLNEISGPGTEVYSWIDKVRARAGLEGVVSSWALHSRIPEKPATKDGLRQIIHQERRIELAFEGQAGWDLRRWKELQNVLTNPFLGWNVFNKTTFGYYNLVTVYQPQFNLRDYLFPIQNYDLLANPNLDQTPYW